MARSVMRAPIKGGIAGVIMTGGWLLADLLLPEPWGDVVLFGAMAVVNVGICWKLGKFYEEREQSSAFDAKQPTDVRT